MGRCEVCGKISTREELFVTVDVNGNIFRGAHPNSSRILFTVCTDPDCIVRSRQEDRIGKAMGCSADARLYLELARTATASPDQSLRSLIGMARKSGSLVIGTESVLQKIRTRSLALVLADRETGKHTLEKIQRKASRCACPVRILNLSGMLEHLLNKSNGKVIGIGDKQMAESIQGLLEHHGR